MIKRSKLLTLAVLGTIVSPFHAHAGEGIDFSKELTATEASVAKGFKGEEELDWASVDLNNDSITELIAKSKDCGVEAQKKCAYTILARLSLRGNQMLRKIGEIEAYDISIASSAAGGLTELQVQTSLENDYDRETWGWNPKKSQYAKK